MSEVNLQQQIAQGGWVLFDLEALEPSGARVKFRFTGGDRVRYLNGQVSNDVRRLKAAQGAEALAACVMNAKGKMNAYGWIHAEEDSLLLDAAGGEGTPEEIEEFREALSMRLERYMIADDVELADVTADFAILHLAGEVAALDAVAASSLLSENGEGLAVQWRRAARFGVAGIDLFVPANEKTVWIEQLRSLPGFLQADAAAAERFWIERGVARWGRELDENTLPAEAGLDTSAIDFHKGCYIGQEIISRIKSVGRVNRNLRLFAATSSLSAGMTLIDAEGRTVGRITSAIWQSSEQRALALGYLKRGNEEATLSARAEATSGEVAEGQSIPVELQPISSIS